MPFFHRDQVLSSKDFHIASSLHDRYSNQHPGNKASRELVQRYAALDVAKSEPSVLASQLYHTQLRGVRTFVMDRDSFLQCYEEDCRRRRHCRRRPLLSARRLQSVLRANGGSIARIRALPPRGFIAAGDSFAIDTLDHLLREEAPKVRKRAANNNDNNNNNNTATAGTTQLGGELSCSTVISANQQGERSSSLVSLSSATDAGESDSSSPVENPQGPVSQKQQQENESGHNGVVILNLELLKTCASQNRALLEEDNDDLFWTRQSFSSSTVSSLTRSLWRDDDDDDIMTVSDGSIETQSHHSGVFALENDDVLVCQTMFRNDDQDAQTTSTAGTSSTPAASAPLHRNPSFCSYTESEQDLQRMLAPIPIRESLVSVVDDSNDDIGMGDFSAVSFFDS